jgi:transposase
VISPILPSRRDAQTLGMILGFPEIKAFIAAIDAHYVCGRRGYGTAQLVAVLACRYLYVVPTWTAAVRTIRDNPRLVEICGCDDQDEVPSTDAVYRFLRKLRNNPEWLEGLIRALQVAVRELRPAYGKTVAGDATDLPAYANGQKYVKRGGAMRTHYSDPDASWGHRGSISTRKGGGFYGYKPHGQVCCELEFPVGWVTRTAKDAEQKQTEPLLEQIDERGFDPRLFIFDKGYDAAYIYDLIHGRKARVVIPLKDSDEERDAHAVPECTHYGKTRRWVYAGTDLKRGATKWRCPRGKCKPKSVWIPLDRFHPAIPRGNARSRKTYKQRAAVERFWSRLKDEWGLISGLRVRRIERVAQHVDLTITVYLAFGLARLRASSS